MEPAFGLPAIWIRQGQRSEADLAGYTVVQPAAVVVTHISEAIQSLGRAAIHPVPGR